MLGICQSEYNLYLQVRVTKMEDEQFFQEVQIGGNRASINFDDKNQSIFNSSLTFSITKESCFDNVQLNFSQQDQLFEEVINKIDQTSNFDSLYAQIKQIVDVKVRAKSVTNKDAFNIHRKFFRVFIKHCLGLISFLWQKIKLELLVKQLQKSAVVFQALNRQTATFMVGFTQNEGQSFASEDNQSKIGYFESPYCKQKVFGRKKTEFGKFKQFLNKHMKTMENCSLILPNQHFQFYLLFKEAKLGQGGFGTVFKAESFVWAGKDIQQQTWAVKQLKKDIQEYETHRIGSDREYQMLTKINTLKKSQQNKNSRHIIEVREVILDKNRKYIIFQFCQFGNLSTFMNPTRCFYYPRITKKHIFLVIYQLAATLNYIHYQLLNSALDQFVLSSVTKDGQLKKDIQIMNYYSKNNGNYQHGVIHRDLKPSNIMIKNFKDHSIDIRIIDWAFSKQTLTEQNINTLNCGTDNYQAPEFDEKQIKYSCKVDVWAFGIIVYQLLTGKSVVSGAEQCKLKARKKSTLYKIENMEFKADQHYDQKDEAFWKPLLKGCLATAPSQRWSSRMVFHYLQKNLPFSYLDQQTVKYLKYISHLRKDYFNFNTIVIINNYSKIVRMVANQLCSTINSIYSKIVNQTLQTKIAGDQAAQALLDFLTDQENYKGELNQIILRARLPEDNKLMKDILAKNYLLISRIPTTDHSARQQMMIIMKRLETIWLG